MDIQIHNHGSIYLLEPLSDAGRAWLEENLDPDAQLWGDSTVVEPRYVLAIVEGARADGLEVN